jgi:hypothetical protein
MKLIIGIILGFILLPTIITNAYAESTDAVWLRKTKRGVEITCPPGYKYFTFPFVDAGCANMGKKEAFFVQIRYEPHYTEKESSGEKEILNYALLGITIIEKKTSSLFGVVTTDVKYKTDDGFFGLFRTIALDDGTVIRMSVKSKYDDRLNGLLMNIKPIGPHQVRQLEKTWGKYIPPENNVASKKDAEKHAGEYGKQFKAGETKEKKKELGQTRKHSDSHQTTGDVILLYNCRGDMVSGTVFYQNGAPASDVSVVLIANKKITTFTADDHGRWEAHGVTDLRSIVVMVGLDAKIFDAHC